MQEISLDLSIITTCKTALQREIEKLRIPTREYTNGEHARSELVRALRRFGCRWSRRDGSNRSRNDAILPAVLGFYGYWAQRSRHISVYWLLAPSFQDITCTRYGVKRVVYGFVINNHQLLEGPCSAGTEFGKMRWNCYWIGKIYLMFIYLFITMPKKIQRVVFFGSFFISWCARRDYENVWQKAVLLLMHY